MVMVVVISIFGGVYRCIHKCAVTNAQSCLVQRCKTVFDVIAWSGLEQLFQKLTSVLNAH